jgi:hypothetical protein
MKRTPLVALAALATATALALTGCVPGEDSPEPDGAAGEWSASTLSLDFAT